MTIRLEVLSSLHKILLLHSVKENRFKLPTHKAKSICIQANGQIIRVLLGNAWITCNGEDLLLESGQETHLPRNRCEAMISPICSATVTFEVIQN